MARSSVHRRVTSLAQWYSLILASSALSSLALSATVTDTLDRTTLPIPARAFSGVIAKSGEQSTPDAVIPIRAPQDAPNVLIVMTDDVGFGASSTFGGPIPTPNLDRLASSGLRYTRFHTTGVCSPSRAALLTGRNHHAVGNGELVDSPMGFPGYSGTIPRSAGTIARILGENGYSTAFFGKHHNVPPMQLTGAGPFTQWPTGLGFDYFFGFIGGEVDQWRPRLYRGTSLVDESADGSQLLDERLINDALGWLHNQTSAAPDRPFFMYLAPGAGHSPHQAKPESIAKFRGLFDTGWDRLREDTFQRQKKLGIIPKEAKLTPRPEQIPSWDSLSPGMRRVNARYMEVYAASVTYFDAQFGRLMTELQRMALLDNTLIVFVQGDNGATAQNGVMPAENAFGEISNRIGQSEAEFVARMNLAGGPETSGVYSSGWSYALNAPFPWFKHQASHLGATRNGMVLAWPRRIAQGGQVRTTFSHLNDILPTVLDAAHIPVPSKVDGVEQQRIDGVSLVPSFDDPRAENHRTQYFEIGSDRAIYHDGWLASTTPVRMPWERGPDARIAIPQWKELYDLRSDFSQSKNLAARNPERLKALASLWDEEARKNNVYPIDARPHAARVDHGVSRPNEGRTEFTYRASGVSVPQAAAPQLSRSFSVTAELELSSADATGVILATGSKFGGWVFYVKHGRPMALHAVSNLPQHKFSVAANATLPTGKSKVAFAFKSEGTLYSGGDLTILVNGQEVGRERIDRTARAAAGIGETFDIGHDSGVPVSDDYSADVAAGVIDQVRVTLATQPSTSRRRPDDR